MLLTASISGEKAQASLLETLKVIEAEVEPETTALVKFARTKVNTEGTITDADALADIRKALDAFMSSMERKANS